MRTILAAKDVVRLFTWEYFSNIIAIIVRLRGKVSEFDSGMAFNPLNVFLGTRPNVDPSFTNFDEIPAGLAVWAL